MLYNLNYAGLRFLKVIAYSAVPISRNALVFMLVAINGHWKIPVGYFLLNSLNGAERASLLEKCLELIEMTGVEVHSVTFDGASVNKYVKVFRGKF